MSDDHEAIRNLTATYALRLDGGDFEGLGELLADASLRIVAAGMSDEVIRGREAIRDFYAGQVVTHDGDPLTRHLITNQIIELDEAAGSASTHSYFTVLMAPPDHPLQVVVGGRYTDVFTRVDGAWRFAEKNIHVDYLNEIGHHFEIDERHRWSRGS